MKNSHLAQMPQMLVALSWSRSKPKQVVIAGKVDDAGTKAMLREVRRHFIPHRLLMLADGGTGQEFFASRVEFMKNVTETNGQPTAYVCENFVCQFHTIDIKTITELLTRRNPVRKAPL